MKNSAPQNHYPLDNGHFVSAGGIVIDGVEGDAVQLQLYGVDGKIQRQVVVNGGSMFVALPSNGTFIVSDGRRKVKFCI